MFKFFNQEEEKIGGLQRILQGIMGLEAGQVELFAQVVKVVGAALVAAPVKSVQRASS